MLHRARYIGPSTSHKHRRAAAAPPPLLAAAAAATARRADARAANEGERAFERGAEPLLHRSAAPGAVRHMDDGREKQLCVAPPRR